VIDGHQSLSKEQSVLEKLIIELVVDMLSQLIRDACICRRHDGEVARLILQALSWDCRNCPAMWPSSMVVTEGFVL
jgi:hypothetical protein